MARRGVRDAGVRAQSGEIGQLPHTPSAQADETLKAREVANLPNPAHIALDVGFEIVAECLPRLELLIVNPRIATRVQDVVNSGRLRPFVSFRPERMAADEAMPYALRVTG